jgi:hypothetical protein
LTLKTFFVRLRAGGSSYHQKNLDAPEADDDRNS